VLEGNLLNAKSIWARRFNLLRLNDGRFFVGMKDEFGGYEIPPFPENRRQNIRAKFTQLSDLGAVDWCHDNGQDRPLPEWLRTKVEPTKGEKVSLALATRASDRDRGDSLTLTPRRREMLQTLASSKTRLTKSRLMAALNGAGRVISKHTVRIELPKMREAGWIDNDQKVRPKGYGATPLGRSILKPAKSDGL
jgi:hypothetical protein